tara:strand:- start:2917 stop:3111 length:195 start_codon:yes stop_codon:yes gene_type:complete
MDTSSVALIITAIAGSIATIVYSAKHIKKSSCCGASCEQVPTLTPLQTPVPLKNIRIVKETSEI